MGRSVNYLSNSFAVVFFSNHEEENEYIVEDIQQSIMSDYPEFWEVSKWEGNEGHIILQSHTVEIGLSEYCGLFSLSIRVREGLDEQEEKEAHEWLTVHASKILDPYNEMRRIGTFSNGESIFEKSERGKSV